MRVHEIAKKLGMESRFVIPELVRLGIQVTSHSNAVEDDAARWAIDVLRGKIDVTKGGSPIEGVAGHSAQKKPGGRLLKKGVTTSSAPELKKPEKKHILIKKKKTEEELAEEVAAFPSIKEDVPEIVLDPIVWHEAIGKLLEKTIEDHKDSKTEKPIIVPLDPAIELSFVRGLQVEDKWTLGYGPRTIGKESLDLALLEPEAPDLCFDIIPTTEGCLFKTDSPKNVKLNGKSQASAVLKNKDRIIIFETEIEVKLIP